MAFLPSIPAAAGDFAAEGVKGAFDGRLQDELFDLYLGDGELTGEVAETEDEAGERDANTKMSEADPIAARVRELTVRHPELRESLDHFAESRRGHGH